MTNADTIHLRDETQLNVASLLLEDTGARRDVTIELSGFPLDEGLVATGTTAEIRLTRLRGGVLAQGTVTGEVELECARCLRMYQQPFESGFTEEFRQTVDVRHGTGITPARATRDDEGDDDDIGFEINDAHELDMTELLR